MASIVPLSIPSASILRSSKRISDPEVHSLSQTPLTVEEFSIELPKLIHKISAAKNKNKKNGTKPGSSVTHNEGHDPIADMLRRVVLNEQEWKSYALFDPSKHYTRNLISTDNSTYTLILLCWNPGKESPIHDHPCDGCWMKVCQGSVQERRYVQTHHDVGTMKNKNKKKVMMDDRLVCNHDNTYCEGQLAYINDFMGYHKVGNPSANVPAVTLHLYCPPFDQCKIWLDPDHASKPSKSRVCYYSEFGSTV